MEYISENFKPKIEKLNTQELYTLFNDNDVKNEYDNLIDIFYHTVENNSKRIAIIDENDRITYQELQEFSDNVASFLDNHSEEFHNYVIVKVKRDWKTIGVILGILKTGRAYVPIQEDAGEQRVRSIMEMTGENGIISSSTEFPKRKENYNRKHVSAEQCAYVIFTSGSTGTPKGVRISHKSVADTVLTMNRLFGLNEYDRILGVSELTFDLSVFDLFGTLAAGAALVIVQDNKNLALLEEKIQRNNVTFINAVPSVIKMLLEYIENTMKEFETIQTIRTIILSGDVVPYSLVEKILKHIPLVDLFISGGPTEITIWSNFYLYEDGKSMLPYVPYGRSIANKTMYIMRDSKLVDGEEGEIVSGGVGLALDYIKDEKRTNKQFAEHKDLGRIYFTGDRGILTKEGLIQILGRMDNQVKINGYRVELEEIESHMNEMEEVSQSITCAIKDNRGDRLVAGVLLNPGEILDKQTIKERLKKFIPEYAIPSTFLFLEKLPLSANNKVDRKMFQKIAKESE